jgi:hypothetical protein
MDEAEYLYDTIELVGFKITQDEETETTQFDVEAEQELEMWMNNIDGIEEVSKSLMARANPSNLGLVYEVTNSEGEMDKFTVSDGEWKPEGSGMDSGTIEFIDRLLTAEYEDS